MKTENVVNIGCIHDIPIGQAIHVSVENKHFAVFRETYGHFCAFADDNSDEFKSLYKGHIKGQRICLPDGRNVNLHNGRLEGSERLFRCITPWVENGFVLLSLSSLLMI